MAPTRRSGRLQASILPLSDRGPGKQNSPVDSANPSSLQTPVSSEVEDDAPTNFPPSRLSKNKLKRNVSQIVVESEDSDAEEDTPLKVRRTSRTSVKPKNEVYVEISTPKSMKNPKKSAPTTLKSAKAQGKARAVDSDEGSSLEYDEEASLEMSVSTGSDFDPGEASDNRQDNDDYAHDSEEEVQMLHATIKQSHVETDARQAGSSRQSRNKPSRGKAGKRRAKNLAPDEDYDMDGPLTDLDESESEAAEDTEDENEIPLAKRKGKAKAKAKAIKVVPPPQTIFASVAERRKYRRELAEAKRREMAPIRALEAKRAKELDRKLTMAEKGTVALQYHHSELRDVWGDLKATIPVIKPTEAPQPANLKLAMLPFQKEGLYWMQKQEEGLWTGGMLADEMGMGKTIQIIALLVSGGRKPNLVVAPTVAIMQWRNEIETHTDGLKVCVWHGASRESDTKALKKHDVVLTTYAVLESSFRKQEKGFTRKNMKIIEKSPIHQIIWDRIILDEAHNIKERSTNTAKAAFELKANYRWCLSGTPLQNRVGELYSLVRFLGGDPFSYYFCKRCDCKSLHWKFSNRRTCDDCGHSPMHHTCFWNNEILTPIQKHGMTGPGGSAFKKLKILLDRMMLRRTKLQRADDLGLPPRTVIVRRDYFSPEEKELYLSLFSDAKRQFTTYLDHGTILNNYSNIFSLLTRMRQMACHPDLVLRSKTNAQKFVKDEDSEGTICRLCNDFAEDAIQSKCRHVFDRECIKQYLNTAMEQTPDCPVCHLPLTIDLEAPALDLDQSQATVRQGILGRLNLDTWRSSTKIEALIEELSNLRLKDSSTKSIVFSQFVNFLDLIAYRLKRAGFNVCRLEGTMSPQARDATIKHFMSNVEVPVFLVSLKAGGVALNLTEASRVYLMDSWWNPAVEYQAMDRIHRLGQHRPVQAIKLVVEDSIESRIVQLQEKKSAMVDATLSADESAMGRLTPEDLGFLFRL